MWKLGDLFARAEGCGSLETCLPGQRGVEAWRPVCQGRGEYKLLETFSLPGQRGVEATRDLQFARAEECGSLETCLPGLRVWKLRDLQFARAEGCGSLETFSLPGQRALEAERPSVCQGRGV